MYLPVIITSLVTVKDSGLKHLLEEDPVTIAMLLLQRAYGVCNVLDIV